MEVQDIVSRISGRLGIQQLNEMQQAAVAAMSTGANVVLLAPTGSGKTLAFLIPLLIRMDAGASGTQAMIITPSRELALQIESVWRAMRTGLKCTVCYGGHKREIEEHNLVEAPALLIGTPGRIADHLRRSNIKTEAIRALVLDEYDKTLEAGFEEEVGGIVSQLPALEQRVLTSATSVTALPDWLGMEEHQTLSFLPEEITTGSLGLGISIARSPEPDKLEALRDLLFQLGGRSAVVFCNHRESVGRIVDFLKDAGLATVAYHGAMEQRDRETALAKFRNGSAPILITTDLAARGLDVPHIRYIIHYHLPDTEATWTHRNGRTARMDASGTAILLLGPGEEQPEYVADAANLEITPGAPTPPKPDWATLYIDAGKKDKLSKMDIVGFLTKVCGLKKEDVGTIEVKDFTSFVAVRRGRMSQVVHLARTNKIKGKKVRMEPAR